MSALFARSWENIIDGVSVVDRTGKILLVNGAFCRLLAMTNRELVGSQFSTIYDAGSKAEIEKEFLRNVAEANFPSHLERKIQLRDGRTVWFHISHSSVHPRGRPFLLLSLFRDITLLKESEERLRTSESRFRAIVEQSIDGISLMDEGGRIIEWNHAQELLTGLSRELAIGRKCWDVWYELQPPARRSTGQRDHLRQMVLQALRLDNTELFRRPSEVHIESGPGRERTLQQTIFPITTERGTSLASLTRDITGLKSAERQLIEARWKVEEASRLKSSLLANLSHEFRTPITGILGMADLLRPDLTDETSREKVDGITVSAKRLHATLEAMLKLAQMSGGELLIQPHPVDCVSVARRAVERFRADASGKGLGLTFNAPEEGIVVLGNDELVTDIIGYLVDNAVKYTNEGSVAVTLSRQTGSSGLEGVLMVQDTGIGIDPAHHEIIFQEFKQVSEGYGRRFEGSGLGLANAKRMTELLGGTIQVRSEAGKGATFIVRLPAVEAPIHQEKSPEPVAVPVQQPGSPLPEVLIVEDNFLNKAVMCNFLNGFCKTDHARDAQSAIEMAKGKRYSAILMDINLGAGQSGLDATKEIRRIPGYEHRPIIAVTGYTLAGDRDRLLAAGLTHYVAKPFDREEIVQVVSQALSDDR